MNDIEITVVGNVATDITHRVSEDGSPFAKFRIGCTERVFDRKLDGWVDGTTSWFSVYCRRELANNVASSLRKGDPVVVTGRMRVREWQGDDGRRVTTVGIAARAVGHDLTRGTSAFRRKARPVAAAAGDTTESAANGDGRASNDRGDAAA